MQAFLGRDAPDRDQGLCSLGMASSEVFQVNPIVSRSAPLSMAWKAQADIVRYKIGASDNPAHILEVSSDLCNDQTQLRSRSAY